jgi:hypothetical protein
MALPKSPHRPVHGRQSYSLEQIKDMLTARAADVAQHYAPPAPGAYVDRGVYFTLNPGRIDKSVGSFFVYIAGPKVGQWRDMATGQFGDLLDLIQLALGCNTTDALREARGYLGLANDDPAAARLRQEAIERARAQRAEAERRARLNAERRRRRAVALFLSGQERLRGTPVEYYLRDRRGIDLAAIGRQPRALRFIPDLSYRDLDPATGEVFECRLPAMVALVSDRAGRPVAVHRTWLAQAEGGGWGKAPVAKPKKVLGDYAGAAINIWSGMGPRGGKGAPLSQCPPGTHVYLTEGIEDALSVVTILPDARVLAGISLSNLGQVALPGNVASLTIVADQDENPEARAALHRAVAAHAQAGREVRLWQNGHGGKDLNDALIAALAARRAQHQQEGQSQ